MDDDQCSQDHRELLLVRRSEMELEQGIATSPLQVFDLILGVFRPEQDRWDAVHGLCAVMLVAFWFAVLCHTF